MCLVRTSCMLQWINCLNHSSERCCTLTEHSRKPKEGLNGGFWSEHYHATGVYLSHATMGADPAVTGAWSCMSYAGKVPTEIMADPAYGAWEIWLITWSRLAMISAKTDRSSSVVRAKVSLVSLPPTILLLIFCTFWIQFSKIKRISCKAASQRLRQLQFWLSFPVGVCVPQSFFGGGCYNTTCPKRGSVSLLLSPPLPWSHCHVRSDSHHAAVECKRQTRDMYRRIRVLPAALPAPGSGPAA